jgi:sortase A
VEQFIRYLRTHGWARRGLSGLSISLVLLAVALLGFPVYTNVVQGREQDRLNRQIASPELRNRYKNRTLKEGDALTRIKIPKLGVDTVVVEGTSASALKAGAGHYPQTPLPCESGNVGIAGHRTTYGKPFANLDRLDKGDIIVLELPKGLGSCTYTVDKPPFPVSPNDFSVIANDPAKKTLTLTTCHPKGSAKQRLVIKSTFVKADAAAA